MKDYDFELKNFNKTDKEEECYKCGKVAILYEDPDIEGLFFCKECWIERFKIEELCNQELEKIEKERDILES